MKTLLNINLLKIRTLHIKMSMLLSIMKQVERNILLKPTHINNILFVHNSAWRGLASTFFNCQLFPSCELAKQDNFYKSIKLINILRIPVHTYFY